MHYSDDPAAFRASRPNGAGTKTNGSSRAPEEHASQADCSKPPTKLDQLIAGAATLLSEPNQKLDALVTEYRDEMRPEGAHQTMLVRELAYADYRIQLAMRIETGLLWLEVNGIFNDLDKPPMETRWGGAPEPKRETPEFDKATADVRTILMGAAWMKNQTAYSALIRYQNAARRDYFRALKQLEAVRTGKAGYMPQPTKPSKPAPSETKPSETSGTDPQTGKPPEPQPKTAAAPAANQPPTSNLRNEPNSPAHQATEAQTETGKPSNSGEGAVSESGKRR